MLAIRPLENGIKKVEKSLLTFTTLLNISRLTC